MKKDYILLVAIGIYIAAIILFMVQSIQKHKKELQVLNNIQIAAKQTIAIPKPKKTWWRK